MEAAQRQRNEEMEAREEAEKQRRQLEQQEEEEEELNGGNIEHPELAELQQLVQDNKITMEEYKKRAAAILGSQEDELFEPAGDEL
jgi:hypothetical protein